jgi:hypothetical protein
MSSDMRGRARRGAAGACGVIEPACPIGGVFGGGGSFKVVHAALDWLSQWR